MTKRKKSGSGPAAAIGGMLAGFDHQIFRTTPPPHELVLKGSPVRGQSGEGGDDGALGALGELVVSLPDDDAVMVSEPADRAEGLMPEDGGRFRRVRAHRPGD